MKAQEQLMLGFMREAIAQLLAFEKTLLRLKSQVSLPLLASP